MVRTAADAGEALVTVPLSALAERDRKPIVWTVDPARETVHARDVEVASFDAVGAFYAMTHVPAAQQRALIASIAAWLRPGGTLIASFGTGPAGEWTGDWLGTTMFFAHASQAETLQSLADAGLWIRHASVETQDNEDAAFSWIAI